MISEEMMDVVEFILGLDGSVGFELLNKSADITTRIIDF